MKLVLPDGRPAGWRRRDCKLLDRESILTRPPAWHNRRMADPTDQIVPSSPHVFPRFCVAFLACKRLNKDAATYLLLAQNTVQSSFEFDVLDLDDLSGEYEIELPHKPHGNSASDFMKWVRQSIDVFCSAISVAMGGLAQPISARYWIVFTERPMPDHYYGDATEGLTVFSIADWNRTMAPPSVLEFHVAPNACRCDELL